MRSGDTNIVGCIIHGGNVKVANSNFTNNLTGILLEDHENGSYGAISNCLVNHNQQLALLARNVANGMSIDNCAFFFGGIHIDNCKGVSITSSIIGCNVKTTGDGANRIGSNYMVIRGESFEFCPATIVEHSRTHGGHSNTASASGIGQDGCCLPSTRQEPNQENDHVRRQREEARLR